MKTNLSVATARKGLRRFGIENTVAIAISATCCANALALEQRSCHEYLDAAAITRFLGVPAQPNPVDGQYSTENGGQFHRCNWIAYYPPIQTGAKTNPVSVEVAFFYYASIDVMDAAQLKPHELGSKVKIERIPKFGSVGNFYINNNINVASVTANKGRKTMSISVEMGANPVLPGTKEKLIRAAEVLYKTIK